ncbi:MAG TPA: DUF1491 family protein [Paracoccus sp. (in: a-proteobacteria)]|uniref:DUF1491 family protein n=1 Tax=uncultured Paracoccus sp. TaxID=189685 RepID=UPI002620C0E6|nr:DUF1491 family protein [uncultured Paracoccus sp.]HMQ40793.1 DUF1491 family protein [Paracoccus sp. (in: a-proteobacteria)]HMR35522.1 DUF1491 family protein [Paracoccus sp. (in: a-proteobacteria)]
MAEARLAAHVWVGAYLRRLALSDIPAYVTRHGDDTAGAIMVKCATLDGKATLWRREWDFESDRRPWVLIAEGPEPEIDAITAREAGFDPDLWLIEIESRDGTTLLDQPGLG